MTGTATGFLLLACNAWEAPEPISSHDTLEAAKAAVPGAGVAHVNGSDGWKKAGTVDEFSILDVSTLKTVWRARWQDDRTGAPVVRRLIEVWP